MSNASTIFLQVVERISQQPFESTLSKITLALVAMWLMTALFRRANPQWRVLIWRSGILATAMLMLASIAPFKWNFSISRIPAETVFVAADSTESAKAIDSTQNDRPLSMEAEQPIGHSTQNRQSDRQPVVLQKRSGEIADKANVTGSTRDFSEQTAFRPSGTNQTSSFNVSLVSILYLVWITGFGIHLIVLAIAYWRIRLVAKHCRIDNSGTVASLTAKIKGDLGIKQHVAIGYSNRVSSPCLVGVLRPIILLPKMLQHRSRRADLPAVLAHELSHLKRNDFLWNMLVRIFCAVFWLHPLCWLIARKHQEDCELVCDDLAATLLGSAKEYQSSLARIAIESNKSPANVSPFAVAMARQVDIVTRLRRMNDHLPFRRLSLTSVAMIVATLSLIAVGSGASNLVFVDVIRNERNFDSLDPNDSNSDLRPQDSDKSNAIDSSTVELKQAVSQQIKLTIYNDMGELAETGSVDLRFRTQNSKEYETSTGNIDSKGNVTFDISEAEIQWIDLTVRVEGHVPYYVQRHNVNAPIVFPLGVQVCLQSGHSVSGTVADEQGIPIADAEIELQMRAQDSDMYDNNLVFPFARIKTDEKGSWECNCAPELFGTGRDRVRLESVTVSHPDFIGPAGAKRNSDGTYFSRLIKGITVSGFVMDAKGNPIKDAEVWLGEYGWASGIPMAKTDMAGQFDLTKCLPGAHIITVAAVGFAPTLKEIEIEVGDTKETAPASSKTFTLEPAHSVSGRVVDQDGNGVAGVQLRSRHWRDHESLRFQIETDVEGRFSWDNAPPDMFTLDTAKADYLFSLHHEVTAGKENSITVFKAPIYSGMITDAVTGRPIPNAEVGGGFQYGESEINWQNNWSSSDKSGKYTFKFREHREKFYLRFYAPGYETKDSTPMTANDGDVELNTQLKPAPTDFNEANWQAIEEMAGQSRIKMGTMEALRQLHDLGADIQANSASQFRVTLQDMHRIDSAMHDIAKITVEPEKRKWRGELKDLNLLGELGEVELQLDGLIFDQELLEHLAIIPSLKALGLSCVWRFNEDKEYESFTNLEQLRHLEIDGRWQVFPRAAMQAISQLKELESLNFAKGVSEAHLEDGTFRDLFSKMSNLKTLGVSGNKLSNQHADEISKLPNLQQLEISSRGMDDGFIRTLGAKPELKALTLRRAEITDEGVALIGEYFPKLEHLDLQRTRMTEQGLKRLIQAKLVNIKSVVIPQLERTALIEFQKAYPDCRIQLIYDTQDGAGVISMGFEMTEQERIDNK